MSLKKRYVRIISITVAVCILIACCGIFAYCSINKAPELDTVRDRFIYLIEGSRQINQIFFGVGLPVYERGGALAEQKHVYIGEQNKGYERVMEISPYLTVDDMRTDAQRIYSSSFCEELFESSFEGILSDGVTLIEYAELSEWLYQSTARDVLIKNDRIYLYDTMKIVRPSNKEYINVDIESYQLDSPESIQVERLSFVLESGNWYLDCPTY